MYKLYSQNTYYGRDKQEEFRIRELKGELDPAIFYKNQQDGSGTGASTSKRNIKGLNLEFESMDKESEKREQEAQDQIRRLNFSVDVSSRSSRDYGNLEDPRMQSFPSKENSQYGI